MVQPPIHRVLVLLPLLLLLLVPSNAAAGDASGLGCTAQTSASVAEAPATPAAIIEAVNAHRGSIGLAPLQVDPSLTSAAAWKARDMLLRDYFAHDDPGVDGAPSRTPTDRAVTCGFAPGMFVGENIVAAPEDETAAQAVVDRWLGSPGHRANLEAPWWTITGIGGAMTTNREGLQLANYVQLFSATAAGGQQPAGTGDCATARLTVRAGGRVALSGRLCRSESGPTLVGAAPTIGRLVGAAYVAPRRTGRTSFTVAWPDGARQVVEMAVLPALSRATVGSARCTRAGSCTISYRLVRPIVASRAILIVQRHDPMRGWRRVKTVVLRAPASSVRTSLPRGSYLVAVVIARHPWQSGTSSPYRALNVR